MIRPKRIHDGIELNDAADELDRLAEAAAGPGLTLLTAAKDRERNHTVALKEMLEKRGAA